MKINDGVIRGYDIRGIVDVDLNPEIMEHLGKAYGTYMFRNFKTKQAVIANDSRLTSQEYKEAFIKGLLSTGMNVIDIGMCLIGRVYWAQYHFKARAAAFITASHNPAEYNGVKISNNFSEAMITEELRKVSKLMKDDDYEVVKKPGKLEKKDIVDVYFNDLIKRFNIKKKFKVLVDASNSTSGTVIPKLLRKAGCEVVANKCTIDG